MNIKTDIDLKQAESVDNEKIINRLIANFKAIGIIEDTLYIKYSGEELKKDLVRDAYIKNKVSFDLHIGSVFNVKHVRIKKDINEIKLQWLESLVSKFNPKNINFSIS